MTDSPRLISLKNLAIAAIIILAVIALVLAGQGAGSLMLSSAPTAADYDSAVEAAQDALELEGEAAEALDNHYPEIAADRLKKSIGALEAARELLTAEELANPDTFSGLNGLDALVAHDLDILAIQSAALAKPLAEKWQKYLDSIPK